MRPDSRCGRENCPVRSGKRAEHTNAVIAALHHGSLLRESARVGSLRWLPSAVALLTAGLACVGVGLSAANPPYSSVVSELGRAVDFYAWTQGCSALLFALTGWYLSTRRPGVIFGPLALGAGLGHGLASVGVGWAVMSLGRGPLPGSAIALWLLWGQNLELPILHLISVMFPDGELPRGWLRWLGVAGVALSAVGVVQGALNPFPPNIPLRRAGENLIPGVPEPAYFMLGGLLTTIVLVVRWRQAGGERRQVLRWLAVITLAGFLNNPLIILFSWGPLVAQAFTVLKLSVITAAVLRYRVYGIDLVLNRALVYALLTGIVAAVYGATVGGAALVAGNAGGASTLLAAILAAFALAPARQVVEQLVNRFLYGQRDEPYAVVSRVAAQLEGAASADQLLPRLLDAVVQALGLPFAAIELHGREAGSSRRFQRGVPGSAIDRFPLVHQGQQIGALATGRRPGQTGLRADEQELLRNLARQAAVAAANLNLTEDLMRSRDRIVNAAEEERRRLRRDLHDGLGSVLTAAASRLDAARNLLERDRHRVDELLAESRSDLTNALDDVRRLVYALRPPALDRLGLLGAVREQASRAPVCVTLRAPAELAALPAALEVAAYRIVSEALTNVARHAAASSCTVTIGQHEERLIIEVVDDGHVPDTWSPGVGLVSLSERSVELGGSCHAGPLPGGGWRVRADLPLPTGSRAS
jgi:signal transduction histidine kinase